MLSTTTNYYSYNQYTVSCQYKTTIPFLKQGQFKTIKSLQIVIHVTKHDPKQSSQIALGKHHSYILKLS